ncbi:UNVERIFIED_ORG: glycosyltransferase involved in cell wall biosynthesis [Buttiauxella agrestis ATCC 33320]
MKNVHVVGIVGIPASYGGFESLVENLTKFNEGSDEYRYTVYCSGYNVKEKLKYHNDARLKYIPIKANGVWSIFYDIVSLLISLREKPDSILILGVSGCVILPFYRFFSKAKVITNIDGLEWRREKWNTLAKSFLKFSEKIAVKYSDVIVADNAAISDYVKQEYNVDSRVIAYGGDHAYSSERSFDTKDYALALCRIEPENNVQMILDAFTKTPFHLKFIGNWNVSSFGIDLKKKYSAYKNIEMIDPIYDIRELVKLRGECRYYVHGHSAGGTNPSLVEIMHFEKPIFCFDCSYNRSTTENKAIYFSDDNDLAALISTAELRLADNAIAMGEIARRRYTWDIISSQYEKLY